MTAYNVNIKKSVLTWTGKKKIGSGHTGTLRFLSGTINIEGGTIMNGRFVIDMKSMTNADLDGGMAEKLLQHLASDDFFSIEKFPTAEIVLDKSVSHTITGKLTIKGITHEISFEADVNVEGDTASAHASFAIDRTKWDIRFGSGKFFENLGDKLIVDDIGITLDMIAQKQ